MKNQYFGDVKDYVKYGILRVLTDQMKCRLMVNWMLTDDDSSGEGRHRYYLCNKNRGKWRFLDQELYDRLYQVVKVENQRNVTCGKYCINSAEVSFFDKVLSSGEFQRKIFFNEFDNAVGGFDLIFFDPDIGMAYPDEKKALKQPSKYLFWPELSRYYSEFSKSLLFYQHRRQSDSPRTLIDKTLIEVHKNMQPENIWVFYRADVAFFLIPQCHVSKIASDAAREFKNKWGRKVAVEEHV